MNEAKDSEETVARDDDTGPGASPAAGDDSGYRLVDAEPPAPSPEPEPEVDEPLVPVPEAPASTFEPAASEAARAVSREFPESAPAVDEVWSRWVEWKQPLVWMAAGVTLATLIVFAGPLVAVLTFLVATAYGAYCVVISLEVPVRVTPEQAVQEFFAAASHRLPNFRRMYALLTSDARQSQQFSFYNDFRSYWLALIARLSRWPAWFIPLEFRVEGYRCQYNGDKSMALVSYKVKITPRGRADLAGSTTLVEVHNLAVKGPDGQWYLNDGSLPEET